MVDTSVESIVVQEKSELQRDRHPGESCDLLVLPLVWMMDSKQSIYVRDSVVAP